MPKKDKQDRSDPRYYDSEGRELSYDGGPVGYKKPPLKNQRKTGDPKPPRSGRGKGRQNDRTVARKVYAGKVTVTRNGKKVRVTKLEALLETAINLGLTTGKAIDAVRAINLALRLFPEVAENRGPIPIASFAGDDTI